MRKQVFGLKELTLQSIEHPQPQLLTIFNSWCPTILLLFIQNSSLSVKDLHLFFSSRIKVFSFHPNHFSSRFQCQCNHSGWISDLGCGLWNPILPISAHGEPRDPSKFVCEPAPCVALSWVLTSAETNSSHFRVILTPNRILSRTLLLVLFTAITIGSGSSGVLSSAGSDSRAVSATPLVFSFGSLIGILFVSFDSEVLLSHSRGGVRLCAFEIFAFSFRTSSLASIRS